MAPPRLAEEQINCGPYFEDEAVVAASWPLKTPMGNTTWADSGPASHAAVAGGRRLPGGRGLAQFPRTSRPCLPQGAAGGDTHHMDRPLAGMIDYIASEKFDRVVILYDGIISSCFGRGVQNLHWFPGLTFRTAMRRSGRRQKREDSAAGPGWPGGQIPRRRLRLAGSLAAGRLPSS